MSASTVVDQRHTVLADLLPSTRVRDASLVLAGTGLIAGAAQLAVPLPFTPVPLSLATFAVLLVGASLGPLRGSASALLYLALGVAGLPVYAGGGVGWHFASFGYIVGYVAGASVVGAMARRQADRRFLSSVAAAALGTLTVYACGMPWLAAFLDVTPATAFRLGVLPFLPGDAVKIVAIAVLLPTSWKLLRRL